VAGEHDAGVPAGVQHRDDVAVPVGTDLVGVGADPVADDVLDGVLVAGGAGGLEEVLRNERDGSCMKVPGMTRPGPGRARR
jgi:hypothetical protein